MSDKPKLRTRRASKPRADSEIPWRIVKHLAERLRDGDPLDALAGGAALLRAGTERSAIQREIGMAGRKPANPFDAVEPVRHAVAATHLLYLTLIREGLLDSYLAGIRVESGRRKGASEGGTARARNYQRRDAKWVSQSDAQREKHPDWTVSHIASVIAHRSGVPKSVVYRVLLAARRG